MSGVQPVNKNDFVAMLHDIQYYQNLSPTMADNIAIVNADDSFSGYILKNGLKLRSMLNLPFNSTGVTSNRLGDILMNYVQTNKQYSHLFGKYGVSVSQYPDNM